MEDRILYISDLDGTLLNQDKEVSKYTNAVINAFIERGGHFSVATARTAASASKILSGVRINVPAVLMNGAVIYDFQQERYIKTEIISTETSHHILDILKTHGTTGFMYSICGEGLITYYENLDAKALKDFHDERVRKYYKTFEQVCSFKDKLGRDSVIYFTLIDEYENLLGVQNSLKEHSDVDFILYRDIYEEKLWNLEIFNANASKYNAVMYLREQGEYSHVVGFGDNYNDIQLSKACDEFYAVSNSVNELKSLATAVIGSNTADGVAAYLAQRESIDLHK